MTSVQPCLPHPPFTGRNSPGSAAQTTACSAGVSLMTARSVAGSEAKMRLRTRKSGLPKWDFSSASGWSSAMRRKSSASMSILRGASVL